MEAAVAGVVLIFAMCCCTPAATPIMLLQAVIEGLSADCWPNVKMHAVSLVFVAEGVTAWHHSQGAAQPQQKVFCCSCGA